MFLAKLFRLNKWDYREHLQPCVEIKIEEGNVMCEERGSTSTLQEVKKEQEKLLWKICFTYLVKLAEHICTQNSLCPNETLMELPVCHWSHRGGPKLTFFPPTWQFAEDLIMFLDHSLIYSHRQCRVTSSAVEIKILNIEIASPKYCWHGCGLGVHGRPQSLPLPVLSVTLTV